MNPLASPNPIEYAYLLTGVLFIVGLRLLGSPKTARLGNRVAAVGMLISLVAVLAASGFVSWPILIVGLVLGAGVGIAGAMRVKMTAMPQMVAIFNGAGGGAAAMVAAAEFLSRVDAHAVTTDAGITIILSAVVGAMSFTGSIIAYLKLQELMTGRPIVYPGQQIVNAGLALIMVATAIYAVVACADNTAALAEGNRHLLVHVNPPGINTQLSGQNAATYAAYGPAVAAFFVSMFAAAALGVLVVLPIGGADMPVIISLLNSFTGLAAATTGFVLANNVLIISGALVGASGTLLTLMMGKAMNRSVTNVLFGAFGAAPTAGASGTAATSGGTVREASVDDVATMLAYANQVVIVPGYGMAVAQAQHSVRELADQLESRGVVVKYAIHPVAGRMPGHMNVLLAEANVPYPSLFDMDDINPEFGQTDVALVIGANDVTNPAARYDKASPIYGMPILDVDKAERVVVLKRSMKPGFAGIDNVLYEDPRCVMLFGDAKKSVDNLAVTVKKL
jgi:NAD(P) transhydrogenase subunit beta